MPDTTFCIAAGGGFEKRLPGGNDDLERDYKINEMFFSLRSAPNQSWYWFVAEVTTSSPHLRQCNVVLGIYFLTQLFIF